MSASVWPAAIGVRPLLCRPFYRGLLLWRGTVLPMGYAFAAALRLDHPMPSGKRAALQAKPAPARRQASLRHRILGRPPSWNSRKHQPGGHGDGSLLAWLLLGGMARVVARGPDTVDRLVRFARAASRAYAHLNEEQAVTEPPDMSNEREPGAMPPKKSRKWIAVVTVIVVLILIPVTNLFVGPATGTPLTTHATEAFAPAALVLERNCLDCHFGQAKLPFYAHVPGAAWLIEKDRDDGIRSIDIVSALDPGNGPAPEVALAKIEHALYRATMPPTRYVLLHWDRLVTGQEEATLLGWIRDERKRHYAVPTVHREHRYEVLQPLPESIPLNADKVALGDQLFHDFRLSGDNTISCASCHALDKGGCDQRPTSVGIGGAVGPINAPTVYNSGFLFKQFWDGRAENLVEQAAGPVHNPIEMGASWAVVVPKLEADAEFAAAFTAVYPGGVSGDAITDAIAEFERSLITPHSRFDQFLMGKLDALTPDERKGRDLFRDRGCATCHVGKMLGGQSFELMGRSADYFADRGDVTEVDQGRFNVTKRENDRHKFKVPTLRNIAVTYPYFHDGSKETLADAVEAMGTYQTDRPLREDEINQIVQFLRTLTGAYNGAVLQ